MSEPNLRKYLPAKISTYTVYLCHFQLEKETMNWANAFKIQTPPGED